MVEQNGYYYDQTDVSISGYWEWQKVADMLPFNYSLEPVQATAPVYTQQEPVQKTAEEITATTPPVTQAEKKEITAEQTQTSVSSTQTIAEPMVRNDVSSCMQQQGEKIINIIKKNISIDAMMYKNKMAEDYTIELTAPRAGSSEMTIDFYRKSSAVHYPQIEQAIVKLKENLTSENFCNFDRLIIPVTIYFEDADKPGASTNSNYENNANNKTYVLKPLGIKVYSRID